MEIIDLNKRYQTMLTLWSALLMSIFLYFAFIQFAMPEVANPSANPPNSLLVVGITALGAVFLLASFIVKRKLLAQSVAKQDPFLVQKAMIVALALCEVSALLGLLERFLIGNREYYLLFILAVVGDLFHFPRRSQLDAASHKTENLWN
jgi:hypothetical protein